ncbi:Phosphoglycerol transferase MdoB [Flexibacter flexilis DSM 6793]|uniref:Phosphoglycerol transferase MdoB n=1 Tax=Flexibacter flexilis DSM 6793 TaxID=927664 RepID=A0A1I1DIB7_9BACT|nr:LTA synthase family protein [Flexibacter flexilis]SFB72808.1 Phosphoglycerol transferase MdoB [Flexibacter flexilis DSM 6793]
MKRLFGHRLGGLLLLYCLLVSIAFFSRLVLLVYSFSEISTSLGELLKTFGTALFFDTVTFSYFMLPFWLFEVLMPLKVVQTKTYKVLTYVFYTLVVALLVYVSFAEFLFWEEFGVRFNFIAVDYLIYTNEVVGNIMESYPMPLLVTAIVLITSGILWTLRKTQILDDILAAQTPFGKRLVAGGALLLLTAFSWFFVDFDWTEISTNKYNKELSKNAIYSFFEAIRNNKIDYAEFYQTVDNKQAFTELRNILQTPESQYIDAQNVLNPVRHTTAQGAERRYNVVLITVESLSGEYMSYIGNDRDIKTPFLDSLAEKSMFFSNLYANGTRTVRGLEAINLSIPPTPGTSIVRRPNNENLYSLGTIFKQKGYTNKFIYGGYGYFDNMSYFFSNNGFEIVDRDVISEKEITFANVWGVCDGDMYKRTVREADAAHAAKEPFFMYVMTTSNHRPYTFPNVVGKEFSKDRRGGVAYTDYALREFFQSVQNKPWADSTIFVVVADHCGGSAGRAELPVLEYQIPMMIYSPKLIGAQNIKKLCSQIDLAPTLLALMNWNYNSTFYGKNVLTMKPEEERAFIGNYQKLGYIQHDTLLILGTQKSVTQYKFNPKTGEEKPIPVSDYLKSKTICQYQTAEYMFLNGLNKVK